MSPSQSLRLGRLALLAGLASAISMSAHADMPNLDLNGDAAAGQAIANDRATGNCVACHVMAGSVSPGAIGPVLVTMQHRYPSKKALARRIWDATVKNPEAVMPPFGEHGVLTQKEFVDVVEYIWSL